MFAYIDPGAGSMVIQAVLAALLSVPFIFRTRVRGMVERLRARQQPPTKSDPGD